MTSEEIAELFQEHDEEFLKFKRIPESERRHRRADLCAFLYLDEKLVGSVACDIVCAAEHDKIWLEGNPEKMNLTEEDVIYLSRCGTMYDEANESFCMFV